MMEKDYSSLESILLSSGKKDYMLTFRINEEVYGIEIEKVKELVRYDIKKPPKTVPDVPEYIIGVVNIRGEIIPVLDIRKRMALPEIPYTSFHVIIILESRGMAVGLIADEVEEVIPSPSKKVGEPPSYMQKIDTSFVKYLCEFKNQVIMVLDTDQFLPQNNTNTERKSL
jgi:purine-binding chemotaxis protein CheW